MFICVANWVQYIFFNFVDIMSAYDDHFSYFTAR